ncbi:hypothetical protein [Dyella telluris]|uniref:Uncharacterized protein n=1 Tax=Dyella telluris TaxID=2763498 RepID=A0A7G8Q417_9GAMM|nr:hypothetical protein [Dyella telluris]QNK01525.1 hypothetical protein H8F01_21235 [Dyella telluris]
MDLNRQFWRDQQAAAILGLFGLLLFWWGYGWVKGLLFGLSVMLIQQPAIWWGHRRR